MKVDGRMWENLVVGDNRGEMILDEATITSVHKSLEHLTSDQWV